MTSEAKTTAYSWVLTFDYLYDPKTDTPDCDSAGTCGPRGSRLTADEIAKHPDRRAWMLYDDDGELYARGFYVGDDDDSLFGPLDDWGAPAWGATEIRYRNAATGKYETL